MAMLLLWLFGIYITGAIGTAIFALWIAIGSIKIGALLRIAAVWPVSLPMLIFISRMGGR